MVDTGLKTEAIEGIADCARERGLDAVPLCGSRRGRSRHRGLRARLLDVEGGVFPALWGRSARRGGRIAWRVVGDPEVVFKNPDYWTFFEGPMMTVRAPGKPRPGETQRGSARWTFSRARSRLNGVLGPKKMSNSRQF